MNIIQIQDVSQVHVKTVQQKYNVTPKSKKYEIDYITYKLIALKLVLCANIIFAQHTM